MGGVDFVDFSIFASAWMSQPGQLNWNPACDISIPKNNVINLSDLAIFSEYWLTGKSMGDISGDGAVDFLDYSILARYWLNTNCEMLDDCDGADFEPDGDIDTADLKMLVDNWLRGK